MSTSDNEGDIAEELKKTAQRFMWIDSDTIRLIS